MHVSDPHILAPALRSEGAAFRRFQRTSEGKLLAEAEQLIRGLESAVAREKPEALVITGDLTTNGSALGHLYLARALGRIEAAGTPVYVTTGNHDVNNPWAHSFHGAEAVRTPSVTPEDFRDVYAQFGFAEAVSEDPASLSYAVDPIPGLRLLFLDSSRYEANSELGYPQPDGAFRAGQDVWIRAQLSEARELGRAVLLFFHHSLFSHDAGAMPTPEIPTWLASSEAHMERFWEAGAVLSFSGHIHNADIAARRGEGGSWHYDIATGAWSEYPHPYRIVELTGKERIRVLTGRLSGGDLPGDGERFLLESRRYFLERIGNASVDRVARRYGVLMPRARRMGSYLAALTLYHEAGFEMGGLPAGVMEAERELWERHAPQALERYLSLFARDLPPRDNDVEIDVRKGRWRPIDASTEAPTSR
jgi:3',5'-cyclic AMP phosphodiesterase CpdA